MRDDVLLVLARRSRPLGRRRAQLHRPRHALRPLLGLRRGSPVPALRALLLPGDRLGDRARPRPRRGRRPGRAQARPRLPAGRDPFAALDRRPRLRPRRRRVPARRAPRRRRGDRGSDQPRAVPARRRGGARVAPRLPCRNRSVARRPAGPGRSGPADRGGNGVDPAGWRRRIRPDRIHDLPRAGPRGRGLRGPNRAGVPAAGRPGSPHGRQVRRDQGPRHHAGRHDLQGLPARRGGGREPGDGPGGPDRRDRAQRRRQLPLPARGQGVRGDRRSGGDDRPRGAPADLRVEQRPGDQRRPPQPGSLDPGLCRHRPHARQAFRRRRVDRRRQVELRRLHPRQDARRAARSAGPAARRAQRVPRRLREPRQRHRGRRTFACRSGCSASRRWSTSSTPARRRHPRRWRSSPR